MMELKAKHFLSIYTKDGLVRTLAELIRSPEPNTIHVKGLSGSLDAVVIAAVSEICSLPQLVVLSDEEEATYFLSDLQSLLSSRMLFFPLSYNNPYTPKEIENANVCKRLETLSHLIHPTCSPITVTYPEALAEKVVKKKFLLAHTVFIKKGMLLDSEQLIGFFHKHDFKEVEFVDKAGQFAIRGSIIDVFDFAHEHPYRIERFDNFVNSVRSFSPTSQLSIAHCAQVNLVPNLQKHSIKEERQSFLDFISPTTSIWIKDAELLVGALDNYMNKVVSECNNLAKQAGSAKTILQPEELLESSFTFSENLNRFKKIEFGNRSHLSATKTILMESHPQMSFNKNFTLLADRLTDASMRNYTNFITTYMPNQLERLQQLLEDINPTLVFTPLPFSLRSGFIDTFTKTNCYTDHQLFEQFYQGDRKSTRLRGLTLDKLKKLQPGDFVTHIDYGIGKFAGMEKREVSGRQQETIRIVFRDDDTLYVSIQALHKVTKYVGKEGTIPPISKLGTGEWESRKARVKQRIKVLARELIELYAKRKQAPGHAFSHDGSMQAELESSFIYAETPDQIAAIKEVKKDMESPHPMDRLVCGDVGLGKTEVAIRAAFKAVNEGKQVAILVPTTILALQHYRTFCNRMQHFPITIKYVSRITSVKDANQTISDLEKGIVDVVIGTHRLAYKKVKFKCLGLLIVDEEQKFGVKIKEKLKEMQVNVDVLTLTATPIPRTLHFSLMGARDLSIMTTPPINRQAVKTELHAYKESVIKDAIRSELQRNGQVFFVHNRINNIEQVADIILKLVPDAQVVVAHGQMKGDRLEKTMTQFIDGKYNVLVATNIIESGLDIPNANTVIINQAQHFGLSDLHQIRGRVGRSNRRAFCYLLTPPIATLSSDARKRLATLEEFSELGDGLKVAMRDLEIRGAGNVLGTEQSGFINDIGFDAYHNVLNNAIQELKQDEFKELFTEELKVKSVTKDCIIETDVETFIPESYVKSANERLQLYVDLNRANKQKGDKALADFRNMIKDRFGTMPEPVIQLIKSVQLRLVGEMLGIEKITLKSGYMKLHFVYEENNNVKPEIFDRVFRFIQKHPSRCLLKEKKDWYVLTISDTATINKALEMLDMLTEQDEKVTI